MLFEGADKDHNHWREEGVQPGTKGARRLGLLDVSVKAALLE